MIQVASSAIETSRLSSAVNFWSAAGSWHAYFASSA